MPSRHLPCYLRVGGAPRYITLTKAFHLVHFASPVVEGKDARRCIAPVPAVASSTGVVVTGTAVVICVIA